MRASLIADASQRIDEALWWLPADTETLFVQQEPMLFKAADSACVVAHEIMGLTA